MIEPDQVRQYVEALSCDDQASRQEALHSLRQHTEKEWAAVPGGLIHTLVAELQNQLANGNKQTAVRQDILLILANIGPPAASAVDALIPLLEPRVPERIREAAAIALGRIGTKAKAAVDPLVATLAHCRSQLAGHVIHALSGIGSTEPKVRNSLVSLWLATDQSSGSQIQVAFGLCKLGIEAEGLLAFITQTAVRHQESALRKSACEALAFCNPDGLDVVAALLIAALHDKDEKVRRSADASLTQLGLTHEQAIVVCVKQLKDGHHAEAALRNSGPLAVTALMEVVRMREPVAKEKALRILGSLGETAAAAAPAVTTALRDKDRVIRLAAAKCLWIISKQAEGAVPVLIGLLDESWPVAADDEVRRRFLQTVIEALTRIGPAAQAAVPALTLKTKDKNRHISESAAGALRAILPAESKK